MADGSGQQILQRLTLERGFGFGSLQQVIGQLDCRAHERILTPMPGWVTENSYSAEANRCSPGCLSGDDEFQRRVRSVLRVRQ